MEVHGNFPACASCKHQRKRCDEYCLLAPYFPASRYQDYVSVHRLFGLSNILRIMSVVQPSQRQITAETLMMQGIIWRSDPISGCLGYARFLQAQIDYHFRELEFVNQQLRFFREREQLQQQKMQLESLFATPSFSLLPGAVQQFGHLASQPSSSSSIPPLPQPGAGSSQPVVPPEQQIGTSHPSSLSSSSASPSLSLPLQYQFDGYHQVPFMPNTPSEAFDTGNKKSLEHGYHYQSTLEEGADIKPFDIQPIDQLIEPYQYEHALTSCREIGESSSKAQGKHPIECDSDENMENEAGSREKVEEHKEDMKE
ncbi:hypothetical protein L1049_023001 [Liquidambar formosana]|uniref:LOB domain-containing protein n=1 Tax=Liquidambar formosana TaxID=63359 RepID=A0AAP0RDH3_LIQFO